MTSTSKGPGAAIHGDSYTIPDLLFDDIDGTSPWDVAISRLSESLKLPGTSLIRSRRDLHSKRPFIPQTYLLVMVLRKLTPDSKNSTRSLTKCMRPLSAKTTTRSWVLSSVSWLKCVQTRSCEINFLRKVCYYGWSRLVHFTRLTAISPRHPEENPPFIESRLDPSPRAQRTRDDYSPWRA